MKFFKCHSQKMKDDKVICLQDKFTDIGPDVFDGFCVEYIILADTTQVIRNYAFSGIGKCSIYLPKTISEIEPMAFENMNPDTTFYCTKGSYAEQICIEHGLIINYDTAEIYRLVDEQKKLVEEQKKLVEDQKRLVEEQKRLVEEQKRLLEEQRLKEEQEKAERARLELEAKKEEERRRAEEEAQNRKVKVFVYDDLKGERSDLVKFDDLPDAGKAQVVNEEIYIHCVYVNNKEKNSFISKIQYEELVSNAKQAEIDQKASANVQLENVKIFSFDDASGEKIQQIKYTELPESWKSHVINGEVYIHKTIRDGQKKSIYKTKQEYERIKSEAASTEKKVKVLNVCPFCKNELLESDMFCPFCGRKVKNIKICSQCGEPNDKDDNFCSNCGTKM